MINMHLLVGLGNIGSEYELTRHNFGFLLLDKIIEDYAFNRISAKKFHSEIFAGEIFGKKIIAIKPQTFMNRSGIAVFETANFYKILPENILVFHDEVDLVLGKLRIKVGGGNAGHNGLKSIDEAIGKDYTRLRLGVGRPENPEFSTADYVLGKIGKEEMKTVENVNKKVSNLIGNLLEGRTDEFLNKFHLV
jgi:PTH1 family peptidyl-tRNA hydrolase